MKISISGHSGIGKTTLAKEISQMYGIPFVTTSSKPIWEKNGITKQSDIIAKSAADPEWGVQFQCDLLTYRKEELGKYPKYVTDRSILDNLVYFIINNSAFVEEEVIQCYIRLCNKVAGEIYDESSIHIHLAAVDNMVLTLENDYMRVHNTHFQRMVDNTFQQVIKDREISLPYFTYISQWDFHYRVNRVNEVVEHMLRHLNRNIREDNKNIIIKK